MFQKYYKSQAQYYADEIEWYNERYLNKIKSFNEAVKKYKKLKEIYQKAEYYINKLPNGYISGIDSLFTQVERNLDRLFNQYIIDALKSGSESECLKKLSNLESDLNNSYGFGFDNYISQYNKMLKSIIEKYRIIYKNYNSNSVQEFNNNDDIHASTSRNSNSDGGDDDPMYDEIVKFAVETGKISASLLQRRFRFGYNRAARLIDLLEARGLIGPQDGSKPREVLVCSMDSSLIPNRKIDFLSLYGTDYEALEIEKSRKAKEEKDAYDKFINSYVDLAQSYFDEKGLNIKFNKNKRINRSKLNNSLFTNTTSEDVEKLVNNILSTSVPNELKLLLIDYSQINLFEYNGISNLLSPVISDYKKANITLQMVVTEMENRYELFLEKRVKNIDSYNALNGVNRLPYIVIVINEIFEMLKFENTRDILSQLLLNGKRAGVVFMCFSKFHKKNIQLFMLEDLFEVHNNYSNSYLELDNNVNSIEIDNVDNEMDGFDFEKYTGKLLKSNGFVKVEVTQSSSDFGVDVIAYKDQIKYAIQCKKYSSPVGIKAVQEVIGSKAMNDCHVAVVLTNNTFTKSAIELAEKNNVLLWDREKLTELIENMNK